MARSKNKERISDALYRKYHWFAIRLKQQMYNRLSHVKDRRRGSKSRARYHKGYYEKNKDKVLKKVYEWGKANKDKRHLYQKRYREKLKKKRRDIKTQINRKYRLMDVFSQYIEYCKDRYQKDTIRLRTLNMRRFFDYLDHLDEERKSYSSKYYKEHGVSPKEEEDAVLSSLKRIKYVYELERDFITRYVAYVNTEEISRRTNLPLNYSEKRTRLEAFRSFLRFCQRKGYIKRDLTRFVISPKLEKKVLKRALTVEEMERILGMPDVNTTLGMRNRAFLELSYSGLRADEMLSLKLGQLDVVDNRIMILNGKGDKDRVVPMTQECLYWMKRWLARRKEFIGRHKDPEYVFITQKRNPILRCNFAHWLKGYAKRAGVFLEITPHDLRRTTATHLAKNGAPIRQIQALLGHSSLRVTTRYLRLTDEEIKAEYIRSHPSNRRALHYGQPRDV